MNEHIDVAGRSDEAAGSGPWETPIAPIPRQRLSDAVATKLTEMIAQGVLPPLTQLPNETELAARFDVGKSAIREAVKIVATRGMLTVQQGSGTVVNPRHQWSLHDPGVMRAMRTQLTLGQLVEVRRTLEPEMAALAAQRATPADLEMLHENLGSTDGAVTYERHHALQGIAFHEAVATATHNPAFTIVFSALRALVESKVVIDDSTPTDGRTPPDPAMDINHAAILAAIEAGDAGLARERARVHLDHLAPYWEWVSQEPGWR